MYDSWARGSSPFPRKYTPVKATCASHFFTWSQVCPYCKVAKRLFKNLGTSYGAIELDTIPREKATEARKFVADLRAVSEDQRTVIRIYLRP